MADEQQMIDLLGVERGCATPMALMNDKEKSGEFDAIRFNRFARFNIDPFNPVP